MVTSEEEGTSQGYSTRSSSQPLFPIFADPKKVYRRKIKRAA
jgi:hypothetical protein